MESSALSSAEEPESSGTDREPVNFDDRNLPMGNRFGGHIALT